MRKLGRQRDKKEEAELSQNKVRKKASLEDGWLRYSGDFSRERAREVKRE